MPLSRPRDRAAQRLYPHMPPCGCTGFATLSAAALSCHVRCLKRRISTDLSSLN
jgi:hypothetical protein